MKTDSEQKILLLKEKILTKRKQFSKINQSNSLKNLYVSQRLLRTRKTQEILPDIRSPFLKNTLIKMFSQKKMLQLQPIIRQQNLKQKPELRIQKSKSLMQSNKIMINNGPPQNQKPIKQAKTQTKQFVNEHFLPMKILKSYGESKSELEFIQSGFIQLKKSLDQIENMKNKEKLKSNRSSRSNSEESERKDQPSKKIIKKLQQLHKKQAQMNFQFKESRSLSMPKKIVKQVKSPVFVVRSKLSKHMYGQQRQQIKLLTSAIETFKGLDLSKGMQVKKYSNFFSKVNTIQN